MHGECSSCHQQIEWATTVPGNAAMPMDTHPADPPNARGVFVLVRREEGTWAYSPADLVRRMVDREGLTVEQAETAVGLLPHRLSHFATCPDARKHRRRR